ncbi:TonB-dependent receptor [Pelagicoccus enzymogenes]|uniref:TonB-dependent receptor n=1 Tax=Pelagicoccus enzymogenes TaxID=2773457 RepID=UPI0028102490|nr:TonB-dependent receptor [Pelagicoccus enzymogenes]MDQ8197038.1 TonB-dependent receptor [Pelagicoccus enzymogenes]
MKKTNKIRCNSLGRGLLGLALPVLALSVATQSWAGEIRGRVVDSDLGNNLRNAQVTIAGSSNRVLTEQGGSFYFPDVSAGEVTLRVSFSGYDTIEQTVTVPEDGTVRPTIKLRSSFMDEGNVYTLGAFEVQAESYNAASRAVNEQKVAINPVKVVAADSLGNVSEGNAGEFLKLMPGVSLDYVEADARSVRISGLAPQYGNVLLEGLFVPSAGSSNIGTGRTFEFEQLSMDSVELVQLTKTPTPDQPSALSGTVDLVTESALDHDGQTIDYSFGLATNSYYAGLHKSPGWDDQEGRKLYPNYTFKYSNVFNEGKVGVIFGLSHHETIAAQKHTWLWHNGYDDNPDNNDTEVPTYWWMWFQDGPKPTTRENYFARVDFLANDNLKLFARVDHSTYKAKFYNRTMSLRPSSLDLTKEVSKTNQTVASGTVSNESNQFMEKLGDTTIYTMGSDYQMGDLTVSTRLNRGVARNWYENLENNHFADYRADISDVSWNWTRPSEGSTDLQFTQLSGPDWRNPSNYSFVDNAMKWYERNSRDEQTTLRVDFTRDLKQKDQTHLLKFGVMFNTRDLEVHRYGSMWTTFTGPDGVLGTDDDPNPGDFVDSNFVMDYDSGSNLNGIRPYSPWKIWDYYLENPGEFVENTDRNGDQRRRNNWYFEEEIMSAYVTDQIKIGKFDIAPGLRYERSKPQGTGWDSVNGRPVTAEGDWTEVLLPYLHANYEFAYDLVGRFSYHESITRADIANLVPGISSINETDREMNANNPNLSEENAKTYYFTLEKYFEPVGLLSVSAFHRIWSDRQITGGETVLGPDGYGGDSSFAGYTLLTRTNATRDVDLSGLEIDFSKQFKNLPKPLTGLGVFGNYTMLDYEDDRFFRGSPKRTANAGVNASIDRFSARLNMNYIGTILTGTSSSYNESTGVWSDSAQPDEFQKERMFFDLNLDYKLSDKLRLFLDARNLTNEDSQYTYRGHESNFVRILKTGTIWKLGVKGTF